MKSIFLLLISLTFGVSRISAQCIVADYSFAGNGDDYSGNGYNANVIGATPDTDRLGMPDSALLFDGIGNYVDTKTSFDFKERTISVWAYVDSFNPSSGIRVLTQDANTLKYGSIGLVFGSDKALRGDAGGGGGLILLHVTQPRQWYHVALIRNATKTKFYVNGQLVLTGLADSGGSATAPNPELVVGTSRNKKSGFFTGRIDDLKIFNCELDSSQVDSLYHLGITGINRIVGKIYFSIHPNPSTSGLYFNAEVPTGLTYHLMMLNSQGQVVRAQENTWNGEGHIARGSLPNGIYLLQVSFGNDHPITRKVILN